MTSIVTFLLLRPTTPKMPKKFAGQLGGKKSQAILREETDKKILLALAQGPLNNTELAKAAGYKSERSIRKKVASMSARGIIERGEKRKWRIHVS